MLPPRRTASASSSASVSRSWLVRLTASTESHWSSLIRPSVLSRVMPALWTTTSTPPWRSRTWSTSAAGGVLGRDVELQRGAADAVGGRGQLGALRGHVEADDVRAVAGEHLGDRRADAARGAGDERDLAVERALPVVRRGGDRLADGDRPARRRTRSGPRAGSAASTRRCPRRRARRAAAGRCRRRAAPWRPRARSPRARAARSPRGRRRRGRAACRARSGGRSARAGGCGRGRTRRPRAGPRCGRCRTRRTGARRAGRPRRRGRARSARRRRRRGGRAGRRPRTPRRSRRARARPARPGGRRVPPPSSAGACRTGAPGSWRRSTTGSGRPSLRTTRRPGRDSANCW